MDLKRRGTRANPQSPKLEPISDPERILKRTKSFEHYTCGPDSPLVSDNEAYSEGGIELNLPEYLTSAYQEKSISFESSSFPTLSSESPTERNSNVKEYLKNLTAEKFSPDFLFTSPGVFLVPSTTPPSTPSPPGFLSHAFYLPSRPTPPPLMAAPPPDPINAARYAPLILSNNLNAFPTTDYMKYLPRFNGEGETTAEEYLISFYNFADNFAIEHFDV